jgi:DNA invertase Pin-like site-specific DNA recombinase
MIFVEKTVAYVRVGTVEQTHKGVSPEAQEERIRVYRRMSGLSLEDVVREEGISAYDIFVPQRPRCR